jgi:hypothetical protein
MLPELADDAVLDAPVLPGQRNALRSVVAGSAARLTWGVSL